MLSYVLYNHKIDFFSVHCVSVVLPFRILYCVDYISHRIYEKSIAIHILRGFFIKLPCCRIFDRPLTKIFSNFFGNFEFSTVFSSLLSLGVVQNFRVEKISLWFWTASRGHSKVWTSSINDPLKIPSLTLFSPIYLHQVSTYEIFYLSFKWNMLQCR